jgi:hypothetical protein
MSRVQKLAVSAVVSPGSTTCIEISGSVPDVARTLWLASTANFDAMNNPEAAVAIPVSSDAEAARLGSVVIGYAHMAFGLHVQWRDEMLVWPNGATLEFSVMGRSPIQGARPALIAVDEISAAP